MTDEEKKQRKAELLARAVAVANKANAKVTRIRNSINADEKKATQQFKYAYGDLSWKLDQKGIDWFGSLPQQIQDEMLNLLEKRHKDAFLKEHNRIIAERQAQQQQSQPSPFISAQ